MQRRRTGTGRRERLLRPLRHRDHPDHRPSNGLLKTAAIIQIVEGGLAAIFGLWLLSATTSDVGGWLDDASGGLLTFLSVLFIVIAAALIIVGASVIQGSKGAIITLMVFQGLAVIGGIGQLGNDGAAGSLIIAAATLGFAIVGFRQQQLER